MRENRLKPWILAGTIAAGLGHPPRAMLPKADCPRCKYREPKQGGHCYMFREKPGDRCGQFTANDADKRGPSGPSRGAHS